MNWVLNAPMLKGLYVMGFAEEELTMPTFHFTSLHVCHVADCRKLEESDVKGWL